MKTVLILGGYGNFGSRISAALVKSGHAVIIAGRQLDRSQAWAKKLKQGAAEHLVQGVAFDATQELDQHLALLKPFLVINTMGPFQNMDYSIVRTCISRAIHYIDLADAREFVVGISMLDALAKEQNVCVISGASTVPGLSSAVLDQYQTRFKTLDALIYGISPGQKAPRGLATTQSILTYLGKPLKQIGTEDRQRFGWQDLYLQDYPELGKRWMANCDIPDLDLFVTRYGLQHIQFSAGMESTALHLGIWVLSYLLRMGLPLNLARHAKWLLALSHIFDGFGTTSGGMHMILKGQGIDGKSLEMKWFIVAKNNDGPQIPCVPAIILARKILSGEWATSGAVPCMGLITLDEYMKELETFAIKQYVLT